MLLYHLAKKKKKHVITVHLTAISLQGGGCWYDPSQASPGQIYLNEVFSSFVLLFLSFGVGLDPRQAALFGPRMGPLLVGASLGLVTFSSSGIIPGYAGAQMNPSRCLAFGIARRNMSCELLPFCSLFV